MAGGNVLFDILLWRRPPKPSPSAYIGGTPIFTTGRLQSHSWRDDDDQPHARIKVQVRNLQILEKDQEPTDSEEIKADAALEAA